MMIFDLVLFITLCLTVYGQNDFETDGTGVKFFGNSGKFGVIPRKDGTSSDGDMVVFQMDYIHELDTSFEMVGKRGNPKHSVESLASTDFTPGTIMRNVEVPYSDGTLRANKIDLTATMDTGATVKLVVYLITADNNGTGHVTQDNETIEMKVGYVKFSIDVDWVWCDSNNTCAEGDGKYVEFAVEIKSKGDIKRKEDGDRKGGHQKARKFELEEGQLTMSNKVEVGGNRFQNQASDYPKCESKNKKTTCTVIITKEGSITSYKYDPAWGSSGVTLGVSVIAFSVIVVRFLLL